MGFFAGNSIIAATSRLIVTLILFIGVASMVLAQSCPTQGQEMWRKTGTLVGIEPQAFVGSAGAACKDKDRNIARHISTETTVRASGEIADCTYTYRLFGQETTGTIEGTATLYCIGFDETGEFEARTGKCEPAPDCQCPDGSCCAGAGGPPPGAAGPPPPNPGRTNAGNPVDIGNGSKSEAVADWVSSKDSRFHFSRYYTSHDHEPRLRPTLKHGLGWSSNWEYSMGRAETSGAAEYVQAPGGKRIGFFVSYSSSALRRNGQQTLKSFKSTDPYRLTIFREGRSAGVVLHDGTGRQIELRTPSTGPDVSRPHLYVSRMAWPDGYAIEFEYDVLGRIQATEDNRGQRAEFEWSINSFERSRDRVSHILVDTNYAGGVLEPEIRIEYEYSDVNTTIFPDVLSRVSATDVVSNITLSDWRYSYLDPAYLVDPDQFDFDVANGSTSSASIVYPSEAVMSAARTTSPKLLSIHDGLSLSDAESEAFAKFSYGDDGMAISTERNGGTSRFDFVRDAFSTTVTNPLGKTTKYTYEFVDLESDAVGAKSNRVKLPTLIEGEATASCLATTKGLDYTSSSGGPAGYVYERIERNGSRTTFERDGRGLVLTKTEDADGPSPRITTYTWHLDLRLPLTRTTSQMSETFVYDADGLLTSYTQTDVLGGSPTNGQSRTWSYEYTTLASGLKVMTSLDGPGLIANGVNDVTTSSHNPDGTIATIIDANGLVTAYTDYDALGNPTRVVDPDGVVILMTYDAEGQLVEVIENTDQSTVNTTSFTYDIIGQMTSMTTASGETWTYVYDQARRLIEISNVSGESMHYTHDLAGNVTGTEYRGSGGAAEFVENATFDELSRVKELLGAQGQAVAFTYDEEDNLKTTVDALSLTTSQTYDALNRLTELVDRAGGTTAMDHDDADRVTVYTDPRGLDTGFVYNGFGETVQETSTDRGVMSYSYDERGLVTSMTDGNGVLTLYAYDNGGRLVSRSFPSDSGQNVAISYDGTANGSQGEGKVAQISDASGSISREYADGGYVSRDLRQIEGRSYDVSYEVDEQGRLVKLTTPGQLAVTYTYDSQDRPTQITVQREIVDAGTGQFPPSVNAISGVTYKPFGPVASYQMGDGATHLRTYDTSYRLTRLFDDLAGTALRDVNHSWTTRDNLSIVSDALDPTQTETYDYTPREFLAEAIGDYGEIDYTYDAVGNRTSKSLYQNASVVTDIYAYPLTSNRLDSIALGAGGTRTLTYDAAGNVTYDNRNSQGYGYAYNAANRMESFSINGVVQEEYLYNALGQQVVRRMGQAGKTIHVVHDLDGNRLAEYEIDNLTGASTLLQEYIWFDGVPVAVVDGQTDEVFFVRTDHIDRPVFATDDTGTKVWEASYLPFGGVHVSTGAAINLRFPGQWFHASSGLHQNWMRDYDPTTGRYIQADPLGLVDGASVYGYALQNPGLYTDPRGEQSITRSPSLQTFVPGSPEAYNAGRAILEASWKYNPIDLAFQWCKRQFEDTIVYNRPPGYWPGDRGAAEWGKRNGLGARGGKNKFHGIKQGTGGSRGDDDYSVNPETGDVTDQDGESVGNLYDED